MITVEDVTKRFGPLVAVDRLGFRIDRGEVVGFLGPNGAGKTTTMRMLTGTLQPDAGRVLFDGRSIGEDPAATKRRIGYLPESNPLYEEMLAAEFLEFAGRLRGLEGRELHAAVGRVVERTGLEDVFFRPIGETSKGYRQRIGLAAAILHEPDVLVLDEPTEGLDPNQRVEIRRLIAELGEDRTVLLSTHVMQEVEATCSRLLIVSRGRLVADGTVAGLLAGDHGGGAYVVEAEGDDIAEALGALQGVTRVMAEPVDGRMRARVEVTGSGELRPDIYALARSRDWVLWELHREQASLEKVFQQLTTDTEVSA